MDGKLTPEEQAELDGLNTSLNSAEQKELDELNGVSSSPKPTTSPQGAESGVKGSFIAPQAETTPYTSPSGTIVSDFGKATTSSLGTSKAVVPSTNSVGGKSKVISNKQSQNIEPSKDLTEVKSPYSVTIKNAEDKNKLNEDYSKQPESYAKVVTSFNGLISDTNKKLLELAKVNANNPTEQGVQDYNKLLASKQAFETNKAKVQGIITDKERKAVQEKIDMPFIGNFFQGLHAGVGEVVEGMKAMGLESLMPAWMNPDVVNPNSIIEQYNKLTADKKELIQALKEKAVINESKAIAEQERAKELGENPVRSYLGQTFGSLTPPLLLAAGAAVTGMEGALPAMNGALFGTMGYGASMAQGFDEAQKLGYNDEESYELAKNAARIGGTVQGVLGIVMGKTGEAAGKLNPFNKAITGSITKNAIKQGITDFGLKAIGTGAEFAGARIAENIGQKYLNPELSANKNVMEGSGEAFKSGLLLHTTMSAMHAPKQILGKASLINAVSEAKTPEDVLELTNTIQQAKANNSITEGMATQLTQKVGRVKEAIDIVPDAFTDADVREKATELILRHQDVEEKLKKTPEALKPMVADELKAINVQFEDLRNEQLNKNKAVEENKPIKFTSGNKDLYGYVEENGVKRNLTKEEFDNYEKPKVSIKDQLDNIGNDNRIKILDKLPSDFILEMGDISPQIEKLYNQSKKDGINKDFVNEVESQLGIKEDGNRVVEQQLESASAENGGGVGKDNTKEVAYITDEQGKSEPIELSPQPSELQLEEAYNDLLNQSGEEGKKRIKSMAEIVQEVKNKKAVKERIELWKAEVAKARKAFEENQAKPKVQGGEGGAQKDLVKADNGEPIEFYHGTSSNFNEFDPNQRGKSTNANSAVEGVFFSDNKDVANSYRKQAMLDSPNLVQLKSELGKKSIDDLISISEKLFNYGKKYYEGQTKEDIASDILREIEQDQSESFYPDRKKHIEKVSTILKEEGVDFNPYIEQGELKKASLKMTNPKIIDGEENYAEDLGLTELLKKAKEEGHDGVIIKNVYDNVSFDIKGNDAKLSTIGVVFNENQIINQANPTPKTSTTEKADAGSVGELNVVDKTKDILDEVTDEKIGEKKYQDFSIDFEDGARAFGTIENGVANISGINAPKREGSVIEPKRGTKTYERVIEKLKENGVKTIKVSLQSQDSQTALSKLVEKGILSNPRDMQGVSDSQFATTFDIQSLKETFVQESRTEKKVEQGKQEEVKFTDNKSEKATFRLIEADDLQPSHLPSGERNPKHLIASAQPKERNDKSSKLVQDKIANDPKFKEVSDSPNAYFGAPIINERGEVIQGNNRSIGLKKHYAQSGSKYKADLEANAEKYGLTKEQVANMKNPILVREVKVSDAEAIKLGQHDVKDLETGGKQNIDPIATSRKMSPKDKSKVASLLFEKDYKTIKEAIRDNAKELSTILKAHLNPAQMKTAFTNEGELTAKGMDGVQEIVTHFLFEDGSAVLPEIYDGLPSNVKKGLEKALPHLLSLEKGSSLIEDTQNAMLALHEFYNSSNEHFDDWAQTADMFKGVSPKEVFTTIELHLAKELSNAKTQGAIKNIYAKYEKLVAGKEADMFNDAIEGVSKKEAIKQQFKIDYDENRKGNQPEANLKPKSEGNNNEPAQEKADQEKVSEPQPKPVSKESVSPIEKIKEDSEKIYELKKDIENKPMTKAETEKAKAEADKLIAENKVIEKANKLMDKLEEQGLLRKIDCL